VKRIHRKRAAHSTVTSKRKTQGKTFSSKMICYRSFRASAAAISERLAGANLPTNSHTNAPADSPPLDVAPLPPPLWLLLRLFPLLLLSGPRTRRTPHPSTLLLLWLWLLLLLLLLWCESNCEGKSALPASALVVAAAALIEGEEEEFVVPPLEGGAVHVAVDGPTCK